jgi:uncharacterized protein with FMN-binding domain
MRRSAAAIIGTLSGLALMTAARLGTPTLADTVATAPVDPGTGNPADPIGTPAPGATGQPAAQPTVSGGPTGTTPKPGTAPSTGTTAPAGGGSRWRNGTFAGATVTHKYGTLQLTIVVSSGKITDIKANYQTESPVSKDINADALPKLRAEALAIQSAQVHTVSGATYTSNAYRTSLQSALDKAKA